MDNPEKPRPICPCCGKELYRIVLPGALIQQLAAMAMNPDDRELTAFLLGILELMHDPYDPDKARRLTEEEEAELLRELERN